MPNLPASPPGRRWRIALCITELDPGGAERQLVRLAIGLDRSRFEPSVVCLAGRGALVDTLEAAGVAVTCLHARGRADAAVVGRLWRHWRATRPDLVQTFLFHANLAGRLAAWAAGVPVMVSGIRVAEHRSRWPLRADRWTQRLVDRHVCVSDAVARFSQATTGLPAAKLVVIPNGVDAALFATARAASPETLGLPPHARIVLSVGRLDNQKDPLRLLAAFERIAQQRPDVYLLFAGAGPLADQIQQQAAAWGDRVRLLGQRDDVPELLKAAACLALSSRWEGMPNVVLEAMAAGTPVVATAVEGIAELLAQGRLGWVCDQPGSAAFATVLAACLDAPAEAADRARRAQQVVQESFTADATIAAYEQLYLHLLGSTAPDQ